MSKKVKIFAFVIIGLAGLVAMVAFTGSSNSGTTPSGVAGSGLVATTGSSASSNASANQFASLLSSINSITIDSSVFSNPAYKALQNYPVLLGTDSLGRDNPFAPVGADGAAASAAIEVQTLAPGKVTATTAEFGALITVPDTVPTTIVFQYGLGDSFGSTTQPVTVTKSGTVLATATGLTPGLTYLVQAVAVRGSSTVSGTIATFNTAAAPATQ